jgi:hypothetical protein
MSEKGERKVKTDLCKLNEREKNNNSLVVILVLSISCYLPAAQMYNRTGVLFYFLLLSRYRKPREGIEQRQRSSFWARGWSSLGRPPDFEQKRKVLRTSRVES